MSKPNRVVLCHLSRDDVDKVAIAARHYQHVIAAAFLRGSGIEGFVSPRVRGFVRQIFGEAQTRGSGFGARVLWEAHGV